MILCAQQPGIPRNLRIADIPSLRTPNSLPIQWDPPLSDGGSPITSYRVYKLYASSQKLVYDANFPAFGDRDVDSVIARYKVSAVSKFGESAAT